jgi:hypothetical protein
MIQDFFVGLYLSWWDGLLLLLVIGYGLRYGIRNVTVGIVSALSNEVIHQSTMGKFLDWAFLISILYLLYMYV